MMTIQPGKGGMNIVMLTATLTGRGQGDRFMLIGNIYRLLLINRKSKIPQNLAA